MKIKLLKTSHWLLAGLLCAGQMLWAQTPAAEQDKTIILKGATVHIGNGEIMEHAVIFIKDGKISDMGDARNIRIDTSDALYINAEGKHIYPGFILPNTTLGLVEIDAVRASRDARETGFMNPHVRSIIAYNTESIVSSTVRTNGILMSQICPRGGRISGTSSIVEMDGWNWEDAVYKEDDGLQVNWPYYRLKKKDNYSKELDQLKQFFTQAKAYSESNASPKDLRMEAMKGLFDGSKQLFIHAYKQKQMEDAIYFAKELGIKNMVLVGAGEAWKMADVLAKEKIPVILERVHALPSQEDEAIETPFKKAHILHEAGVLFCLNYSGDMERMGSRNLPFTAGTTVAYGMDKEDALSSITLNTAKILGIDQQVGSIEIGKDATLFISTGDALDMRTLQVEEAFIRGKQLDLTNHQIELYEKYKNKK